MGVYLCICVFVCYLVCTGYFIPYTKAWPLNITSYINSSYKEIFYLGDKGGLDSSSQIDLQMIHDCKVRDRSCIP